MPGRFVAVSTAGLAEESGGPAGGRTASVLGPPDSTPPAEDASAEDSIQAESDEELAEPDEADAEQDASAAGEPDLDNSSAGGAGEGGVEDDPARSAPPSPMTGPAAEASEEEPVVEEAEQA